MDKNPWDAVKKVAHAVVLVTTGTEGPGTPGYPGGGDDPSHIEIHPITLKQKQRKAKSRFNHRD